MHVFSKRILVLCIHWFIVRTNDAVKTCDYQVPTVSYKRFLWCLREEFNVNMGITFLESLIFLYDTQSSAFLH